MPSSTMPSPLPSPLSPSSYSLTASTPRCIDSYENEPPTQVLPFLYVGNARDAANLELLQRLKIRYVLSVTMVNPCLPSHPSNANTVPPTKCDHWNGTSENNGCSCSIKDRQPELRTKLIPVSDNLCENLAPYFDEACDFIEEARKSGWSILIHCQAGISRSPTIAIAYIMKHTKLSTLEAYAFVQRCRRIISPNLNFMGQLVEFETKLKSGDSVSSPASTPNSTSNNIINANSHLSSGSEALSTCFSSSPCSSENNCQESVEHLLLPNISLNVRSSSPSPCTTAPGSATIPMILAD
ncbi:unnamed protein product [Allacma fusca]|uniref:protein-tyrosine-phosphatase n=1 Tax=Allacma fusca TaxID=39272 RepID=A0A8J2PTT7_9HEXA|nr:unnamed protein product [Allacma fusca]